MSAAPRWPVAAWLLLVAASTVVVARTTFTADLSAFLPRAPTAEQQVLVGQLREGVVSRLVLVALEGAAPAALAQASRRMAQELRAQPGFASVDNGDGAGAAADREFLWRHRYLLSPGVTPERFTVPGLRERLEETLRRLDSPAGALVGRLVPADPTGELIGIVERFEAQARPASRHGAWFSPDQRRALLLAQTRAPGYDIDAQERASAQIRDAFASAGAPDAKLLMSGAGLFAVSTRAAVRDDAFRLSLAGTVLVTALLLAVYRSPRLLGLGLLPIASGALAGVAAVSLGFGSVHGITLGFGVTLIGEGVDYAIYLFTQAAGDGARHSALERIWPTLRLGVLTSICGFSAMLFSGFTGLAQLGVFSVSGLLIAVAVTRWVLPVLLPAIRVTPVMTAAGAWAATAVQRAPALRVPLLLAGALVIAAMALQGRPLWSDDLRSLSPVPRADQLLDQQLRRDIGAPDVRQLIVIHAADEETALQRSEAVGEVLRKAAAADLLDSHESPSDYLPSRQSQRARQQALPPVDALRANLRRAQAGLPFRDNLFEPFLKDAAAARAMPLVERGSLKGTRLELRLDTLLLARDGGWIAMLPLRNVKDPAGIAREVAALPGAQAVLLDLKQESDRLYRAYRTEAVAHSLLGAAAIALLLGFSLRSPRRVFDVLAPLAAAVLATAGVLALAGYALSIFHLVGLLLVVAIGSNYTLFFDHLARAAADRERTIVSLLLACVTTLIGFGLLALSKVPVLHDIGLTVSIGTSLALLFAAALARADAAR